MPAPVSAKRPRLERHVPLVGDHELGNAVNQGRVKGPRPAVVDDGRAGRHEGVQWHEVDHAGVVGNRPQLFHLLVVERGDALDVEVGHRLDQVGDGHGVAAQPLPGRQSQREADARLVDQFVHPLRHLGRTVVGHVAHAEGVLERVSWIMVRGNGRGSHVAG
ncbi:hypothetical protein GCM10009799_47700 [Nocardiopsis rhodophaea]|uniref:Uncharacterized protein n=1 Tax=Nocardiopsis rhodophaea TaxID=280238 RepID=A0ABN2TNG2_9ACTN